MALPPIFGKTLAKGIISIIPEMFKDHKGKWSSKRTVSGVLAMAAVSQIDSSGITWQALILALIAVAPLLFLRNESVCNKCNKNN